MKENQLIHGDSLEILKSFPDNSIDAVITDPPYGYLKHKLDAYFDHKELFPILYQILKDDSLLLFFGRGELLARWIVTCCDLGMKFKEEIVWDKCFSSSGMSALSRFHELVYILEKGNRSINRIRVDAVKQWELYNHRAIVNTIKRMLISFKKITTLEQLESFKKGIFNVTIRTAKHDITTPVSPRKDRGYDSYRCLIEGTRMPSIFRCHRENYNYQHPTQKPLKLIKQLVELTTNEGDLVLDPFCGSGTTAIACLELNRKYICIEKDKEYYEIAKERIAKWHNKKKDGNPDYEFPKEIDRIVVEENNQLKLF